MCVNTWIHIRLSVPKLRARPDRQSEDQGRAQLYRDEVNSVPCDPPGLMTRSEGKAIKSRPFSTTVTDTTRRKAVKGLDLVRGADFVEQENGFTIRTH